MADYFPGKIEIGGVIKRKVLPQLVEQINLTEASIDSWDSPHNSSYNIRDIEEKINNDGIIILCNTEARYGEFPELETWLVKNKISFNRHSSARYENDAEFVVCRFDKNNQAIKEIFYTIENESILVRRESVLKAYRLLEKNKISQAMKILSKEIRPEIDLTLSPVKLI